MELLERRDVLSATIFEYDGIAYFLNQADPGFSRYDIASEKWIAPIDLTAPAGWHGADAIPTAAHADEGGLYVAFGVPFGGSVYRYGLDGSDQRLVINTQYEVRAIHTDGNLLFVNYSTIFDTRIASVNKTTNLRIDVYENYRDTLYGSSIDVSSNRIFGRKSGVIPSDILYVSYKESGDLFELKESDYHGDYPDAKQTWVFDDGSKVVDNSGTIYTTAMQYAGSFGSAVTDIDFVNGQTPVVLSGSTIAAYSTELLPTGSATVPGMPEALFVNDTSAIVFSPVEGGWTDIVTPLTSLVAPRPGEVIDPEGLAFTPDTIEITVDGSVLLFSKEHASVFRFDPFGQKWLETIPLVGEPLYMAYSGVNNTIYLGYETGLIRAIDLADPTFAATAFATLPTAAHGLSTAGEFVFAADSNPQSSLKRHFTFAPDGVMISSVTPKHYAHHYTWSEANRMMYSLRDWSLPLDMAAEPISATGVLGFTRDTPLHDSSGFAYPIRVSPDGAVAILGSGVIHDARTLARLPQTLANEVQDIAWLGSGVYSIRTLNGAAELQRWNGVGWVLEKDKQLTGVAVSLSKFGEDRLLAVTLRDDGTPLFTVVDSELNILPRPTPVAVAGDDAEGVSGTPITLNGSSSFDPDQTTAGLTYSWRIVGGPGAAVIDDSEAPIAYFLTETAGEYLVELLVSDGTFADADLLVVTVRERFHHPWTGDFTGDGWVDAADYTSLRDQLGSAVAPFTGADANGDGWIDDQDLAIWRLSYGANPGSSITDSAFAARTIDEPVQATPTRLHGAKPDSSLHLVSLPAKLVSTEFVDRLVGSRASLRSGFASHSLSIPSNPVSLLLAYDTAHLSRAEELRRFESSVQEGRLSLSYSNEDTVEDPISYGFSWSWLARWDSRRAKDEICPQIG
jgi:hypothetical protein